MMAPERMASPAYRRVAIAACRHWERRGMQAKT